MSNPAISIEGDVFAHPLINPPAQGRRVTIQIRVSNQNNITLTNKGSTSHQTQFGLNISNPSILGLMDNERHNQNKFIDDVLSAFNLVLKRVVLTRKMVNISETKTQIQKPILEEKSKVTRSDSGWEVQLFESVNSISEEVSIMVGTDDILDENKVVETLTKLNNLKSTTSTLIQHQDLNKSLNEYNAAMCDFDKLQIFKHLYNSIELATNCDGTNRDGNVLDIQASSLSGTINSDLSDMREFYNRTKHIDRNSNDVQKYVQGLQDWLSPKLDDVRSTAQRIILHRLCQL